MNNPITTFEISHAIKKKENRQRLTVGSDRWPGIDQDNQLTVGLSNLYLGTETPLGDVFMLWMNLFVLVF